MSDTSEPEAADAPAPKKKSRALLIALLATPLLGGAGFYGVYSGMILLPFGAADPAAAGSYAPGAAEETHMDTSGSKHSIAPTAFVPLEAMVISLGPDAKAKHLKVRLTIEVEPGREEEVTALTPRVLDVLNTFLRAVDETDFEIPRAMLRLRAQMLRRVQLVTPEGAVRDLLIQEFLLT